jgi:hypothetical protein
VTEISPDALETRFRGIENSIVALNKSVEALALKLDDRSRIPWGSLGAWFLAITVPVMAFAGFAYHGLDDKYTQNAARIEQTRIELGAVTTKTRDDELQDDREFRAALATVRERLARIEGWSAREAPPRAVPQ